MGGRKGSKEAKGAGGGGGDARRAGINISTASGEAGSLDEAAPAEPWQSVASDPRIILLNEREPAAEEGQT